MKVHNKGGIISRIIAEYHAVAAKNHVNTWVVTQSTLIMLKTIPTGGTTNITFGVLTSDQPVLPQEVRLNINDEFVITEMALQLYGIIGNATGPAGTTSNRYWTYAPFQLAKAFITIMPFWDSGQFTLLVNGTQVLKNVDTNQFERRPRTNINPVSAATTIVQASLDEADGGDTGYVETAPTITLSGARTNIPSINFLGGVVSPVTNYTYETTNDDDLYFSINTFAWLCRGVLAQNAAQFQGQREGNEDGQLMNRTLHTASR